MNDRVVEFWREIISSKLKVSYVIKPNFSYLETNTCEFELDVNSISPALQWFSHHGHHIALEQVIWSARKVDLVWSQFSKAVFWEIISFMADTVCTYLLAFTYLIHNSAEFISTRDSYSNNKWPVSSPGLRTHDG